MLLSRSRTIFSGLRVVSRQCSNSTSYTKPIIVYDGVCNLCNAGVRTVIRFDPKEKFLFSSAQSEKGKELLEKNNLTQQQVLDRFVLIEPGNPPRVSHASTAALRIAKEMSFPFPILYPFIILPAPIRDILYDIAAKTRYRLFGKTDKCQIPNPNIRKRFIDLEIKS